MRLDEILSDLELKSAGSAAAHAGKSAIVGLTESDDEREIQLSGKAKPFFPYGFAPNFAHPTSRHP
jgi:hypothetical protein